MRFYFLASVYGQGNYGSSTYQTGTNTTTPSPTTSTGTSSTAAPVGSSGPAGVLANTGLDLVLAATIGSVIIFSALVVRFWKKPAPQQGTSTSE